MELVNSIIWIVCLLIIFIGSWLLEEIEKKEGEKDDHD